MSAEKTKTSAWSWKISPDDLKEQVEGYDTLKITQTYRGMTVLVVSALLALSLLLGYFEVTSLEDVLFSLILYIPLLFFVYKGHKWAIIALFILWTIEKVASLIYSIDAGGSPIGSIIWFLIVAPIIYKAYIVEKERSKLAGVPVVVNNNSEGYVGFCSKCGERQSEGAKFCKSCGNQISN